jgi:asparagine synthase (glutamine-hydrolysing)
MDLGLQEYLRALLQNVVRDTDAPAVLFSGGLDTTVLAFLAARKRGIAALTVAVQGHSQDEPYADRAARLLGLTHVWVRPSLDDLLGVVPQTVRILRTFDPATVRNSVATHVGLLALKEMHIGSAITGDGADELFAGYPSCFEKEPDERRRALRRLWKVMTFSTVDLGRRLGVQVQTPYLHPTVRQFAERLPPETLVRVRAGRRHGKAVLREAFHDDLPEDLLWREKCPAEFGSGTAALTAHLAARVPDDEHVRQSETFRRADGVRLRDKEHLYYYRLYRAQFGPPRRAAAGRACPDCGSSIEQADSDFCRLCGAWPVP